MKLLLYCTKSKPYLIGRKTDSYYLDKGGKDSVMDSRDFIHNGKIVAECDYEVEEIKNYNNSITYYTKSLNQQELLNESCLGICELDNYLKGNNGYAIHIKHLHIFDEPKELNEFYKLKSHNNSKGWQTVKKAPQNMMRVDYINIEKDIFMPCIIISIRPEWLCKILNGEKTIEIRKKVLKGMLKNE